MPLTFVTPHLLLDSFPFNLAQNACQSSVYQLQSQNSFLLIDLVNEGPSYVCIHCNSGSRWIQVRNMDCEYSFW